MDRNSGNLDLDKGGKDGSPENVTVGGASSEENANTSIKVEALMSQDGEGHFLKAIDAPLRQIGQRSKGNSRTSVDKKDSGNATANNSGENLSSGDKEVDLGRRSNGFRLAEALVEAKQGVIGQNMLSGRVEESTSGRLNSNYVNKSVGETVIVINREESASLSTENRILEVEGKGLGLGKALAEKLVEAGEARVIDTKALTGDRGGLKESWDGEKVCRICHLTSEQSQESTYGDSAAATATGDLIQLGCGCKDELGIAHRHCAEAWFKLKGNRTCEICGETAKNITGVGDLRFIEGWNEQGFSSSNGILSEREEACWRGQPFCNFLMACLVISFVLPWFFRVNMF